MNGIDPTGAIGLGTEIDGRYRIEAEIGAGGVGAIYRATHIKLGRAVAIKVIRERLGTNSELRRRFEREARALATLSHPHVVTITDYGFWSGSPYLVMELLEGETLDARLGRGPLDPDEALDVLRQLLRAMSFIHGQGLVHRDLKPGNVFLQAVPGAAPHVKVLDFGLAKFLAPEARESAVTHAGQVFGTPSYMAPEQVNGEPTNPSTDVYALGILLFEMLSGRPPFRGNMAAILHSHIAQPLPRLDDVNPERCATGELDLVLRRATAKRPTDRYQSADDLAEALDRLPSPILMPTVAEMTNTAESAILTSERPGPPRRRGRSRLRFAVYALWLAMVFVGSAAAFVYFRAGGETVDALLKHPFEGSIASDKRNSDLAGEPTGGPSPTPEGEGVEAPTGGPSPAPEGVEATGPASPTPAPEDGEVTQEQADDSPHAGEAPSEADPERTGPSPSGDEGAKDEGASDEQAGKDVPPGAPRIDAQALWEDAPKLLKASLEAVDKGVPLSRRTLAYVHQYNRDHAGDPRGHLVLARSHLNRGWRKDALAEYAGALKLNPDVRADPRIIEDLLALVAEGSGYAAAIIEQSYGKEALGAIDAALRKVGVNKVAEGRLERLRDDLSK